MIKTPLKYNDFLTPDQSLQLMAVGITDKTSFYWHVDKNSNLAKLQYKAHQKEITPDHTWYKLPAYSIACMHSLFPISLVATTGDQIEISVNKEPRSVEDLTPIYVQAHDLREAWFKMVYKIVTEKHFPLIDLNLIIHDFNTINYEY